MDERSVRDESGEELLDEERDAVAVALDPRTDLGRHVIRLEAPRDDVVHVAGGERVEAEDGRALVAPQAGERGHHTILQPGGAEAEQRVVGERVGEVLHHRKGLGVRPVEVLDDEQSGLRAGEVREPHHGLAEQHGRLVGASCRVAAPLRVPAFPRWPPKPASVGSFGGDGARKWEAKASVSGR